MVRIATHVAGPRCGVKFSRCRIKDLEIHYLSLCMQDTRKELLLLELSSYEPVGNK